MTFTKPPFNFGKDHSGHSDISPPVPDDVAEISEDDLSVIIAEEISRNTIPVDYTEIGNAPAKAIAKYYPNGLKIIAEVEQVTVPSRAASTPSAEVGALREALERVVNCVEYGHDLKRTGIIDFCKEALNQTSKVINKALNKKEN